MRAELHGDMPAALKRVPTHAFGGIRVVAMCSGTVSSAASEVDISKQAPCPHAMFRGVTDVWVHAGTVRNAMPGTSLGVSAMCAERTWRTSANVRHCCLLGVMLCLNLEGASLWAWHFSRSHKFLNVLLARSAVPEH